MDHSATKATIESQFVYSVDPPKFGRDPFWQANLVEHALSHILRDPFEKSRDLRGLTVCITLHDDGLHATVEIQGGDDE